MRAGCYFDRPPDGDVDDIDDGDVDDIDDGDDNDVDGDDNDVIRQPPFCPL